MYDIGQATLLSALNTVYFIVLEGRLSSLVSDVDSPTYPCLAEASLHRLLALETA
jgi:hypothetical protein